MTFSEINVTDLDAVKRRLAGISYRPHHWIPVGDGAEKFTVAYCTKCNVVKYSGKDFCDEEGLAKFWIELENRRDCNK